MFRIHSRFDAIALCEWHECSGCPELPLGRNREATGRWLAQFLTDDARRSLLRDMVHVTGDGLGLGTVSTQQVVDQLVDCFASGRVRVCGKLGVQPHESAMNLVKAMAPPGPAPAPVARSSSVPAAAPPEAATLPPIDAGAMAAVLVAAAEDGVPFCEICEKKKQARQAASAGATA